jgi:hypothetical protein
VVAKATEGTYYQDADYAGFKAQAAHVGAIFSAYHFLKAGGGVAQAEYCYAMVGSTPVMLDVETEGSSKPNVQDCLDFIVRMRSLGGRVWGAYIPRWYWEQVGGNLAELGVAIVASGYPGSYSDTDANWNAYGGVSPQIWQYTDSQPYGGQHLDFNAFKGTVAELAALINGTTTPTSGGTNMSNVIPASIAHHFPGLDLGPDFPANAPFDPATADIWADARAEAAWRYGLMANQKLDQLLARPVVQPVDLAALESFIVEHQAAGTSAAELAQALVAHLGIQVVAK